MSLLNTDRLKQLQQFYLSDLLDNTLPFWITHSVDPLYGGCMTCLDREGNVFDTDKGIWQQGRFAWVLGHLYNNFQANPQWLEICAKTLDFLKQYGFDSDGRMFFQTTRQGLPIRKRRYAFSESFAAVSFGEYARATGSAEAAEIAQKCYLRYANHQPTPPKFTDVRPMIGMATNMINIVTAQQLRVSIGLKDADQRIDDAIAVIHDYFMKPDLECVMECVAPNGDIIDSCDGRLLNPGHAIEGSWFIINEGKIRNKPEYIKIGLDILNWSWNRGWDDQYGGLFYFRDVYNKPSVEYWHDMKFWWNHNEAIIATLLAFQVTGEEKYALMHDKVHNWSYDHFADKQYGDWYGYLHRDGSISSTQKGNIYKGCFHLPRMQWQCYNICSEMLEKK